jgi:hypothetical protein
MTDLNQIVFLAIKETSGIKYLPVTLCVGAIDHVCYQQGIILNDEERIEAEKLMIETLNKLWGKKEN